VYDWLIDWLVDWFIDFTTWCVYTVNETKQTLKCQVKINSLNTGSGILVTSSNGDTGSGILVTSCNGDTGSGILVTSRNGDTGSGILVTSYNGNTVVAFWLRHVMVIMAKFERQTVYPYICARTVNLPRAILSSEITLFCQFSRWHVQIYHHHHISVMELGHLLTRSGLTYPDISSKVCHNSFCQLENSVSLPWVIYYEAFYLHVVSSYSCILVICPEFVLTNLSNSSLDMFVRPSVHLHE
jgi:hypothetical protein